MKKTAAERFWSKVDKSGPLSAARPDLGVCWLWTAATSDGYGRFWDGTYTPAENERIVQAHRWAYEALVGPIPVGLELDHLCRVTACVNPSHLEAVTGRVNVLRSESFSARHARKTHCPRGHPYDEANTHVTKRNERKCRACHAAREYARKHRLGLRGKRKART